MVAFQANRTLRGPIKYLWVCARVSLMLPVPTYPGTMPKIKAFIQ